MALVVGKNMVFIESLRYKHQLSSGFSEKTFRRATKEDGMGEAACILHKIRPQKKQKIRH